MDRGAGSPALQSAWIAETGGDTDIRFADPDGEGRYVAN
jgi:hypothetical protein